MITKDNNSTQFIFILGCEDGNEWSNAVSQYNQCIEENQQQIQTFVSSRSSEVDPLVCRLMEKMLDCSELLSNCMESHLMEATNMIFNMPVNLQTWSPLMENCQAKNRYKRSAGKRLKSAVSRVASSSSIGRTLSQNSRIAQVSSSHHGAGGGLLKSLLGNKASTSSGLGALAKKSGTGGLAKKGIFGKVGKYAVAGLAAYGTYKLAKAMTKGLRSEYDEDDCWQYSILRDRYECVCSAQCNVYVGSSASLAASFSLLAVTSFMSIFYGLRF